LTSLVFRENAWPDLAEAGADEMLVGKKVRRGELAVRVGFAEGEAGVVCGLADAMADSERLQARAATEA
jgi:hypothetical protein